MTIGLMARIAIKSFSGKVIQLYCGDSVVYTIDHFFRYLDRLNKIEVEPITKFIYPGSDLIKFYRFPAAISF